MPSAGSTAVPGIVKSINPYSEDLKQFLNDISVRLIEIAVKISFCGLSDISSTMLFPCAHGRKVRQFADVETQLLDDAVYLVKHIKELPVRQAEIFSETVDYNDYPVSVASVTLLDCWIGIARDSTFCQRHKTVCKAGDTRRHTTRY